MEKNSKLEKFRKALHCFPILMGVVGGGLILYLLFQDVFSVSSLKDLAAAYGETLLKVLGLSLVVVIYKWLQNKFSKSENSKTN